MSQNLVILIWTVFKTVVRYLRDNYWYIRIIITLSYTRTSCRITPAISCAVLFIHYFFSYHEIKKRGETHQRRKG